MKLFPDKPASLKTITSETIPFLGMGFGLAAMQDYPWQAGLLGGTIGAMIFVLIPSSIINLIHYIRRPKSR